MRLSMIRAGITTVAAAIALAACGGHGVVPSQSGSGVPMGGNAVPQAASPCAITGIWDFGGACITGSLSNKGGTFTLPKYANYAIILQLGANSLKKPANFIVGDATGNGDITGTLAGKKWKGYSAKTCQKGASCPGTAAIYMMAYNKSKSTVSFKAPSAIVVASKSFPGKACFPGLLTTTGWAAFTPVTAPVKKGKVTIGIPPVPQFQLPVGPLYVALVCQ